MRLKSPQTWPGAARGLLVVVLVTVAYYVTGRPGSLFEVSPGRASALWPPSGVALAAVLVYGRRVWPGIAIGSFFLNVAPLRDAAVTAPLLQPAVIAGTLGLAAAAQALLGAWLIERSVDDPLGFGPANDILRFLILGGPVSGLVGATSAVVVLVLGGDLPPGTAWFVWCTRWVSEAIGVILFAPLVLMWIDSVPTTTRSRRLSVSLPIVAMVALAAAAFFFLVSFPDSGDSFLPNRSRTAWTVLAGSLFLTALFEALLLVLTGRAAVAEAVVRQRTADLAREAAEHARVAEALRGSEVALRSTEALYRTLAEQSSDFIARQHMDGVLAYASPTCRSLLGYEPEEMLGRSYFAFVDPADVDHVRERIRAAAAGEPGIATMSYRMRRRDGGSVWLETTLRVLCDPATKAPSEVLTTSRDVSDRKRMAGLQDLLGTLSHDLKNPLTAVLGFAEILRDLPPDDPQRDEFLARIEANAHSALSLATNFVDASRIQSGTLAPRLEPVFLNEMIERVLRYHESRARMKQIRLESHLDRSDPMALLDPRLFDRVVANLVNNAIKFSPTKSSVRVETGVQNGSVVVRVQDQGPGIPEDRRATLFEALSETGSQRAGSSGLGLFIVKTLVDAQGGRVGTEFPPGGGTIFEIVFPAGRGDAI